MKAKRDYELVKNGKYNMRAIMQRAWAYMKQNKSLKWYSFAMALKSAWADAILKMDEYKSSLVKSEPIQKNGNVLRNLFLGNHPEYKYYDSSWR
jgi:hypothetical protein